MKRALVKQECPQCHTLFTPKRATQRYCAIACYRLTKQGGVPQRWYPNRDGYLVTEIVVNGKRRFLMQHRWLMEKKLGRRLTSDEIIHHINRDRADNRDENLELGHRRIHASLHGRMRTPPTP